MDSNDLIKQFLMIGIGTTSLVAEKIREVSDQWVQDGKLNTEEAQSFADELMSKMKVEQGNFEAQMERQLRNIMYDFGVPRQKEIDELRGRIDRLEHQLRELENKSWR
jgi:polyhydroxyalkanoate synthesis regulator phasin